MPRIDVLIPAYNEEAYIGRCLDETLAQDYPRELMRVLLVDAGSTDGTVAIARERAGGDPRLVIVGDGRRLSTPEALNVGLDHADAELVARVDAHGYPEPGYLRLAAEAFATGGDELGCVGGRPVQEGETRFGRALAIARASRFGVGGSEYAGTSELADVDTVQCGAYRRDVLERVGRFDPAMNFGEDEELNWRVRRAGYRIALDARIRFHYVTRPSFAAAFRQYRNYGEARVRVVAAHPEFLRPHHLAPAVLVASAGTLGVASLRSRRARRALAALAGAYGAGASAAAAAATRRADPGLAPLVAAAFLALHLGYGTGMLRGLAKLASARLCSGRALPLSSPSS